MDTVNRIRNCSVKFRSACPEKWERLSPTPVDGVKLCGTCNREVFFCESDAAAVEHALSGHCIAKPMPDLFGPEGGTVTLTMGKPEVTPPEPTPAERLLREEHSREASKTIALRDYEYASRTCPSCGYPCVDWLKVCGVCGFEIGRAPRR